MTWKARQASETDIYHVIARGAGRRILFEDDIDRTFFLERLQNCREQHDATLFAWCLMDNHIHLLIKAKLDVLARLMQSLCTSYARFFNGRHGHVGPVFQGRFKSIPVENDAQFMETVRYIHLNPLSAGISRVDDYEWSSFRSYLSEPTDPDLQMTLNTFGGERPFMESHHENSADQALLEFATYNGGLAIKRHILSDSEAQTVACRFYGKNYADSITTASKEDRDKAIRKLRAAGLSVRQLERLTGIGRGIIQGCRPEI